MINTMDKTLYRLAEYASCYTYEEIPQHAISQCKLRIIDSIGCASAAYNQPMIKKLHRLAQAYSDNSGATVWGTKTKTSTEMAAFTNGAMVRYLDMSDTYLSSTAGHPSDMIAALIASAEVNKVTGKKLITSIIVAYDIYCGFADAVSLSSYGFDQATLACIGVAGGIGNQIGLSTEHMKNAISFAITSNLHLYNIRTGTLSDWKSCAGPNGARNGVFSAYLAKSGISAPPYPFEGKGGLFEALEPFAWADSKKNPRLLKTHLKLHPVCYHGQAAIDATVALRPQVHIGDISQIRVNTYEAAFQAMGNDSAKWHPTTRETADHSLPYTIAVTLLEGKLSFNSYDDARFNDPAIQNIMGKIEVTSNNTMTKEYPQRVQTEVSIHTDTGESVSYLQNYPMGHCENPLAHQQVEQKFLELFENYDSREMGLWIINYILDLENKKNIIFNF